MSTILTWLTIQLVFLFIVAGTFYAGYRLAKYEVTLQSTKTETTPTLPEIDEQTKRAEAQRLKDFQAVMSYDVNTAMKIRGDYISD